MQAEMSDKKTLDNLVYPHATLVDPPKHCLRQYIEDQEVSEEPPSETPHSLGPPESGKTPAISVTALASLTS